MKIGMFGAGCDGGALGTLWSRAGHTVMFSSPRLERRGVLAQDAGASVGSFQDAAAFGEVLLLAVLWSGAPDTLRGLIGSRSPPKYGGYISGLARFRRRARDLVQQVVNLHAAPEVGHRLGVAHDVVA